MRRNDPLSRLVADARRGVSGLSDALAAFPEIDLYDPEWTSTGTAPDIGDGALAGEFGRMGRLIWFRASLVLGAGSTLGTGNYRISLPVDGDVPFSGTFSAQGIAGLGNAGVWRQATTSTVALYEPDQATQFNASTTGLDAGDEVTVSGLYLAA